MAATTKAATKARALLGGNATTLPALQLCASTVDGLVASSGTAGCLIQNHDEERFKAVRKQYCDLLTCP